VDATAIHEAVPPPDCCPVGSHHFALFLDAGGNFLQGKLGTGFNTGFSLNAGGKYLFTNHSSAEGIFLYHHLPEPSRRTWTSINFRQTRGRT
jgi:hypothetical protein